MSPFVRLSEGTGWIEVITGAMFSGKSQELLRRIKREHYAQRKVQVFKPSLDTRSGLSSIQSRAGSRLDALSIAHIEDIRLDSDTQVVAIDEGQFFYDPQDPATAQGLGNVCNLLADKGVRVIVSGLDMDFRGDPFPSMASLLARAEHVTKLHALCTVCGAPAPRSMLKVAPKGDFMVGSDEYEARCRKHHNEGL